LLLNLCFEGVTVFWRLETSRIGHGGRSRVYVNSDLYERVSKDDDMEAKQANSKGGQAGRIDLFVLAAVIYTYRTVVDERDIHHGLKDAVFYFVLAVQSLELCKEFIIEFFGLVGAGGFVKVWFVALFQRSQESELRDCRG